MSCYQYTTKTHNLTLMHNTQTPPKVHITSTKPTKSQNWLHLHMLLSSHWPTQHSNNHWTRTMSTISLAWQLKPSTTTPTVKCHSQRSPQPKQENPMVYKTKSHFHRQPANKWGWEPHPNNDNDPAVEAEDYWPTSDPNNDCTHQCFTACTEDNTTGNISQTKQDDSLSPPALATPKCSSSTIMKVTQSMPNPSKTSWHLRYSKHTE